MNSRDDYPILAQLAAATKTTSTLPPEAHRALNEIDTLRAVAHYAAAWRDALPDDAVQILECRDLVAVIDHVLREPTTSKET